MNKCKNFVERKQPMRNGVKVYDCDTRLRPTVETIIPFLDPELREQAPQWEKTSSVSSAYLRMKLRVAQERKLARRLSQIRSDSPRILSA